MTTEIKIPQLGESITEAMIAEWLVKEGDSIAKDQNLVSIDSEKATVEIPAPAAGKLIKIVKQNGDAARPGDVIGQIESNGSPAPKAEPTQAKSSEAAPEKKTPEVAKVEAKEPEPKESTPQEAKHDFRPRIISTSPTPSEK